MRLFEIICNNFSNLAGMDLSEFKRENFVSIFYWSFYFFFNSFLGSKLSKRDLLLIIDSYRSFYAREESVITEVVADQVSSIHPGDHVSPQNAGLPVEVVADRVSPQDSGLPTEVVANQTSPQDSGLSAEVVADRVSPQDSGLPAEEIADRISPQDSGLPAEEIADRISPQDSALPTEVVADRVSPQNSGMLLLNQGLYLLLHWWNTLNTYYTEYTYMWIWFLHFLYTSTFCNWLTRFVTTRCSRLKSKNHVSSEFGTLPAEVVSDRVSPQDAIFAD